MQIQWARASQFNWAFDNMGGALLQEAVAGAWEQAVGTVGADGRLVIQSPLPGGGQVYFIRGIWRADTQFPWDGFWAEPMAGDLVNYFSGGSFTHQGGATLITLGRALPAGTRVQLYYIYLTGETSRKYEPLNTYPCIRRAYRSPDDYTYDFAVDRMLDLMVILHLAGREQGRDYRAMLQTLWEAFYPRQESRTPPLVYDSFERQLWDRGGYLMYRGATPGLEAFSAFQTELTPGAGRALRVGVDLPAGQDAAWFGYGLNWSLETGAFQDLDRVSFQLLGQASSRRVHNLTKVGSGSAALVILGDYGRQEKRRFVVQVQTAGEVGTATFKWSRDGGKTWAATSLVSGDAQHPVALEDGLEIYWEPGEGVHLTAGDYWTFWGGDPAVHPRRLLAVLNDASEDAADPWGPEHTFVHALPDRFSEWTAFELPFSQFRRRDNLIDDRDRVRAMWGGWYSATRPDDSDITICDREETEVLLGDTFYTQTQVTWALSSHATAFGVWVGIDSGNCTSAGRANLNFLIKPTISGANSLNIRVKVKDARGSYFYQNRTVQVNVWQRVTVNLEDMLLESGVSPLTHPLQAADIGVPQSPPSNGVFLITDVKFDAPLTFAQARRLRVLEFRLDQQGFRGHVWRLDDVALNLEVQDPYPGAPRLAISLTPYGQNPWRGPTLVHYAQPLAPYLVGALNLTQNYVNLHRDAQEEFHRRYGGVKGPILPVHTRNDVENISTCGEENFGRFCWWPRYRDYGKVAGFWHFNTALTDASGKGHDLQWQGGGDPVYNQGLCQPGDSAAYLDGGHYLTCPDHADFNPGAGDFTLEVVLQRDSLDPDQRVISKLDAESPSKGYEVFLDPDHSPVLALYDDSGSTEHAPFPALPVTDTSEFHYLGISVDRDGQVTFCVDGVLGAAPAQRPGSLDNTSDLYLGRFSGGAQQFFTGKLDLVRIHKGRALSGAELQDNRRIIEGSLNGSAYPEVGYGLGQYWAFMRLAQYYFVSNDPQAWEILDAWLNWLDSFGAADGPGWKFPLNFSEFGFQYGAVYDPGAAAAIALGCLEIYGRRGDERACLWARRILDDLRENRVAPEFGLYKSDYHYGWLNALVLQAFGAAVNGRTGEAYPFAATGEDQDHFDALMGRLFSHSGDVKPNLLNDDLIPFTYGEAQDLWDYAPHYLTVAQMGTLEALVLMLGAALEYGRRGGDWTWFHRLLGFILVDNRAVLTPSNICGLTMSYDQAGVKNLVRVRYADYDRDSGKYAEARDDAAINAYGEQAVDLDFRYGGPVILENPDTARVLASRLLKRLGYPWEGAEVETWLEGARIEVGDTVAVSSDFQGLKDAEFTAFGKELDLGRRRVSLSLGRPLNLSWSWAVDGIGTAQDSWAIDQDSGYDPDWAYRGYV